MVVALHELALVWQDIPTWIPLAIGGALILAVAVTYERRRREMNRLKSAIGAMR